MEKSTKDKPKFEKFIKDRLILAPMVRINTLPFRLLVFDHGCDITYTEEIIAKKLMNSQKEFNQELQCYEYYTKKERTLVLRTVDSEKNHLILQLGASSPDDAVKAAKVAEEDIIGIDLNMGCPKHFSTHGNMGSSLLNHPELAKDILEKIVKEFPTKIISCKIRLLEDEDKFKELLEIIQSSGIDFFTIHLRYKDQNSKFPAKWDKIELVKKYAKIPFVINGDIFAPKDIQYLKKKYGCEGFMIGRGAIHNPNIFDEYKNLHEDVALTEFNQEEESKPIEGEKECSNKKSEVQMSVKLTRAIELKYNNKKIDVLPMVKEFVRNALKYKNIFGNTKYIVLYILKTHRNVELFQKIQASKKNEDLIEILDMNK